MNTCTVDLNNLPPIDPTWVFDFSMELSVEEFIAPLGFAKTADAVLNIAENFPNSTRNFVNGSTFDKKIVDFIPVSSRNHMFNNHNGIIYAIVFDGKIVKLGMSSTTLKERLNSYNCGTRAARAKGTCSTTNFHIIESIYGAILRGIKVEIYSYHITSPTVTINMWNDEVPVKMTAVAKEFEKTLLQKYKEITGTYPWLSFNG